MPKKKKKREKKLFVTCAQKINPAAPLFFHLAPSPSPRLPIPPLFPPPPHSTLSPPNPPPLFRRIAFRRPSMDSRNLSLKRRIHDPVSGQGCFLVE